MQIGHSYIKYINSKFFKKDYLLARQWWCTPVIPALRRQRQGDLCQFKASLVYRVSSRMARAVTQRNQKINSP